MNLVEMYEEHEDEYLKYDRILNPKHKRPDICAFLMLDELVPGSRDMVSGAEHDKIWLDVDMEDLAEAATKEQIIDLIRCGVMFDDDGLSMFV